MIYLTVSCIYRVRCSPWTCPDTDLLLGDHRLVDKVLQLLIGEVDAQLLEAVHCQVLQRRGITESPQAMLRYFT